MENKDEIWVVIPETNERYSVSNFGKVRANWTDIPQRNLSYRKRIERTLTLSAWTHTNGYVRVALGRGNLKYVHRLVAQAFVHNPNNFPQVDHIDGDRSNNYASNLRWVTADQNSKYGGERHNWESQRIASAKRRIHDAKKSEYLSFFEQGYSLRRIAKLFGTSHSVISNVLKTK
jgi:hypothetical protein